MNLCDICNNNPNAHSFKYLKIIKNKLVFYTCPSKANNPFDTDGILQHMKKYLEYYLHDKEWIWIIDFTDFGIYQSLNISFPLKIISFLKENNFFNNLYKIKLKNHNIYSNFLIASIWSILSNDIKNKILF